MKKYIFFLNILGFSLSSCMQQNLTPQQAAQQALERLPLIQAELGRSVDSQQGQAAAVLPNQRNIDLQKQRLQGQAFDRLCHNISAGKERLHVQRTAQEAIAHVTLVTAAAQEAALQDSLIHKSGDLDQARLKREETEGELGTLQEIKNLQEQQKQKAVEFNRAKAHLKFLKEEVMPLDEKLAQLNNHLNTLSFELNHEIMATQQALRALKNS